MFDLGSSSFWLKGLDLKKLKCDHNSALFNPYESDTYTKTNRMDSVSYLASRVTGSVVKDIAEFESIKTMKEFILIQNCGVGVAFIDGIMGLSPDKN